VHARLRDRQLQLLQGCGGCCYCGLCDLSPLHLSKGRTRNHRGRMTPNRTIELTTPACSLWSLQLRSLRRQRFLVAGNYTIIIVVVSATNHQSSFISLFFSLFFF